MVKELEHLEGRSERDGQFRLLQKLKQVALHLRKVLCPGGDIQRHLHGQRCARCSALALHILRTGYCC